jgi:hypothetical protein
MYNLTNLTTSSTISDMVSFANEVTGGLMIGLFLFAIFAVLLLALKSYDFDISLFISSTICFILSLLLLYTGMLNFMIVLFFLVAMALSGLWIKMTH